MEHNHPGERRRRDRMENAPACTKGQVLLLVRNKFIYSFWELYSVGNLIIEIFSSTVKCIRKCGGEWVKLLKNY